MTGLRDGHVDGAAPVPASVPVVDPRAVGPGWVAAPALVAASAWRVLSSEAGLVALLVLAAILRVVALPDRGVWEFDQGRDLLVLRSLIVDGAWPLVGPVTSVGGLHHGAAYFYLLAPIAALSGLDPAAIVWVFAVAGVATVGLVWWLARSIGGPAAGFAAGLLVALSPAAIASSVTIWNANLVGTAAALTLAAAWRAWSSASPRWWALSIAALGLTVQLHVLGVILVVPVLTLLIADLRRRSSPGSRRAFVAPVVGGLLVVFVLFIPLLVHEIGGGFTDTRAALAFLGGGGAGAPDPLTRLLVSTLRIGSWPLVGLVVDAPIAASIVALLLIVAAAWRWAASAGEERTGTRWLVGTLAFSALALTFAAPELAKVVRGLPNDQYHAFTDPIVPVLAGMALAGLVAGRRDTAALPAPAAKRRVPARGSAVLAIVLAAALVGLEAVRFPPLLDPGGGWPAAASAAQRVVATTGDRTILVVELPRFEPADGFVFPLLQLGRRVVDATGAPGSAAETATLGGRPDRAGTGAGAGADGSNAGALVVICDRLFEPTLAASCGGAAERAVEGEYPELARLVDRFNQSGRFSVSVYLP